MVENVDLSAAAAVKFCPHNLGSSCGTCGLSAFCVQIALDPDDIAYIDRIVGRSAPLQKGEHLFRENDSFASIFAVRSGAIKVYQLTDDGGEQVTSFAFPGEVIGMDAISKSKHASSAVALETSAVCEIPFDLLDQLSDQVPTLRRRFFQLMSEKIIDDQQLITLLGKNTAEQRIATLLLSIAARNARQKRSATRFSLPMSRIDIGNYYGLTVETVSRVLGRLQKLGLIEVNHKEVRILNLKDFQAVASGYYNFG